jgi:hypothetical protein
MPDPELLQTLDYILNRSDEASIEVLTEAVVRRKRDLSVFNAMGGIPDPQRMAREITEKINTGIGGGIDSMRNSVREMIIRIIKEHAPELSASQVDELCRAWLPGSESVKKGELPNDMLISMIEQFISFSRGTMDEAVDQNLRDELGAWPERYWNVFPQIIRQIISDLLKEKISDKEFNSKLKQILKN